MSSFTYSEGWVGTSDYKKGAGTLNPSLTDVNSIAGRTDISLRHIWTTWKAQEMQRANNFLFFFLGTSPESRIAFAKAAFCRTNTLFHQQIVPTFRDDTGGVLHFEHSVVWH